MELSIECTRFKQVREDLNLTQSQFGEQLGLKSNTADIERGKTRITGKTVMLLLQKFQINPLWLFGESKKKILNPNQNDILPKAITINQVGSENILLVNQKASAGYGSNIGDQDFYKDLPSFAFPLPEFQNATFRGFQIKGDSMIPFVFPSDWVLAKALSNFHEIINNQIYIIVEADSIRLKKIRKKEQENQLELISLNADYPNVTIDSEDILEIWQYHSKISIGDNQGQGLTLQKLYEEVLDVKKTVEQLNQ